LSIDFYTCIFETLVTRQLNPTFKIWHQICFASRAVILVTSVGLIYGKHKLYGRHISLCYHTSHKDRPAWLARHQLETMRSEEQSQKVRDLLK